ncbi:MAG TPA: hydroxymethylbilane synthase [Chthoniobacterales bacterium]|jgi:hydroxymethylbilane synthase|nr:hydroxymethylbilane synthase [Chthoniobacterales bacterium]
MARLVLGSRGSELARTQTGLAVSALRGAWPDLEIETRIITTSGDERSSKLVDPKAGRKGLFTAEIERALLAGEIDVAVHSAKDLPSDAPPELEICGALPRGLVEDVLITKRPASPSLGEGDVLATGSVRRQCQMRWKYPRVEIVDLRGNVPTRLRKLVESDWTGIVLAGAGLERLGCQIRDGKFVYESAALSAQMLDPEQFVPAGGQGIIALQVRRTDAQAGRFVRTINDPQTLACLEAEREFLHLLQGDCDSPVGALAIAAAGRLRLRAQVFDPPGIAPRMGCVEGEIARGKALARELWEKING